MKTEIKLESKLSQFADELQTLNKEEMKIILGGAYSGTSSGGGGGGGRSVSTRGNDYSSATYTTVTTGCSNSVFDLDCWDFSQVSAQEVANEANVAAVGGFIGGAIVGAPTGASLVTGISAALGGYIASAVYNVYSQGYIGY